MLLREDSELALILSVVFVPAGAPDEFCRKPGKEGYESDRRILGL